MKNESKTAAVVVTFNKVDFLKQNLAHLFEQSVAPLEIVVIDNASSDATQAYMTELVKTESQLRYIRLPENIGGAGGFNAGIKAALANSAVDYVWLMDDDTMPDKTALEQLLVAANDQLQQAFGFLVSNTRWVDESAARMNVPETTNDWNNRVAEGLIGIKTGTFVSFMTSRKVVEQLGLPIKEFFIWSDDIEFSSRISAQYPSYFVANSIVHHQMAKNQSVAFLEETEVGRLPRYFYSFRNKLYIERRNGKRGFLRYCVSLLTLICSLPFKSTPHRWQKEKTLIKGFNAGLVFKPSIEKLK